MEVTADGCTCPRSRVSDALEPRLKCTQNAIVEGDRSSRQSRYMYRHTMITHTMYGIGVTVHSCMYPQAQTVHTACGTAAFTASIFTCTRCRKIRHDHSRRGGHLSRRRDLFLSLRGGSCGAWSGVLVAVVSGVL